MADEIVDSDIEIFGEEAKSVSEAESASVSKAKEAVESGAEEAESEAEADSGSLFRKRKETASEPPCDAPAPPKKTKVERPDRYKNVAFAIQFGNLRDLRQLVTLLVNIQEKSAVDGVLFHVVHNTEPGEDQFSGLVTSLFLNSVMVMGRVDCNVKHFDREARTSFYVNVNNFATQLRHIKQDNVCVITKYIDDPELVINAYADAVDACSTQRKTLSEMAVDSYDPDYMPDMQYNFNMVISAADLKSVVQEAVDITAETMELTLFRNCKPKTDAPDITSFFQFNAKSAARNTSMQQRYINRNSNMEDDVMVGLDTLMDEGITSGRLVEVSKRSYTVETLKSITMAVNNQHQITLCFGEPQVKNEDGKFETWEEYVADMDDDDRNNAEFVQGAMYFCINLGPDTYIKVLLAARVDTES